MKFFLLCGLCVTFVNVVLATNLPKIQNIEDNFQEVDKTRLIDFPEVTDKKTSADEQYSGHSSPQKVNDDIPNANEPESESTKEDNDDIPKANEPENLESNSKKEANDAMPTAYDVESEEDTSINIKNININIASQEQLENVLDDSMKTDEKRQNSGNSQEIHRCSLPLGMENGEITDNAITASSYAAFPGFRASRSRLNTVSVGSAGYGAWVGAKNDGKQWLKIDMGDVVRVTGMATQGRQDANQWTTLYTLSYSIDGIHWADFKINSIVKQFSGNTDRNDIVKHSVTPYIEARFVRFNVKSAVSLPALRVELYGCRKVHSCTEAVGIEDGRIPDSAMTSSSDLSGSFNAKEARLNLQKTAWIPKVQNTQQYLRIDLAKEYSLTKVSTQGRYNVEQYVKRYTLRSSLDGSHWVFYKPDGYNVKLFSGNTNGNAPVTNVLKSRIEARFIEFHPTVWQSYIAMRVEVYGCPSKPSCYRPLGFEDGRILNGQLTGSSATALDGRLYGSKAWIAAANNVNQFLQVDFVRVVKITGIATQGRPTHTQYVKNYRVSYSVDGLNWVFVRQYSVPKVFSGNNDRNTVIKNEFDPPLYARFVKIHPTAWQGHICLRMELYGCNADGLCFLPLGLEDKRLGDQFMTASSYYNVNYKPSYGRLNGVIAGSNKGSWLAKVNNQAQWLQVDFGRQNVVTKIAIQGRYDGLSFVQSFTLSYSQDGNHWAYYRLASGIIKVFGGVADRNTIRFNSISPSISAKFVRVHPQSWHGHIAIRMELYGCHLANTCTMPLGIEDKRIPDSAITASSEHAAKFAAKFARLNLVKTAAHYGGWCTKTNNNKQWIQIELNHPTIITKIAIQGRQDHPQWVKSFTLQFSYNANLWSTYKHESRTVVFPGNFDHHTVQVHHLRPPIYGKFLRLNPLTWHGLICMRMEIYGCIANSIGQMAITA